jgi:methylenetetrahydrofolate reductase (NADPH)
MDSMVATDPRKQALSRLVARAYLEVFPTPTILERLVHLPHHSYLSITCSPTHGIGATLDLVERLRAAPGEPRLKLIPHIAARMVRDRGHLREILQRLDELRVESIFVPGGDAAHPVGVYDCSFDLLRDMAEIGHSIEDVGVAAHPEGHPLVNEAELLRLLLAKQPFATYFVTQMCFDADALVRWLVGVRAFGVTLPAWVGLPGVVELPRLMALSLRIGVGKSVRLLKKQKGLVRRLAGVRPYQPDDLLAAIGERLDDPALNIDGFHLFSFNNIEKTEQWRQQALRGLVSAGARVGA